jgi:hypothetical protein
VFFVIAAMGCAGGGLQRTTTGTHTSPAPAATRSVLRGTDTPSTMAFTCIERCEMYQALGYIKDCPKDEAVASGPAVRRPKSPTEAATHD